MTEDNRLSRRDWFRLRPPRAVSESSASDQVRSMGDVSHGMHPIAQPENHDGMDLSALPPMREALLSEEQVHEIFSDIESLASNILLMQRSVRSQRATPSIATNSEQLRAAHHALVSGSIPRVQIRYHWQGADWIDTLERRDDGVRLVRISHGPIVHDRRTSSDRP